MLQRAKNWFYGTYEDENGGEEEEKAVDIAEQIQILSMKQKAQDYLIVKTQKEAKEARDAGDRQKAIMLLKRKKQYEMLSAQLAGQITNLQQTQMTVDSMSMAADQVAVMKQSTVTMTEQLKALDVNEVQEIKHSLNSLTTDAMVISSVLSDPLDAGLLNVQDEMDIDAQLAEWDDEAQTNETAQVEEMFPLAPERDLTTNKPADGGDLIKNS